MNHTTITLKRSAVTLVVLAVLAALLPACGGKETPIAVPAGAQAGDLVGWEPCTYEASKVKYGADCGTLVVPENRSDPDSRLIALPVIRVHALNDSPAEPIFFLQGGPGISNLGHQHLEGLVGDHDFVQVGYRGVEGSSVLDCPETVDALKAADDMLSQVALESFNASIAGCAERLQREGVKLVGYTLFERIDDMEAARAALGYERINLLSESVGTRTGLFYTQTYPESIHRSALIAVNPPGHFLWKAEVIDAQIEDYAALCAQDAGCSARTDDLAETMREVARDVPKRWLLLPIRPGTVKLGSFFGMFNTSTGLLSAPAMIGGWRSAAEGDASGFAMMSLFADLVFPASFLWGETSATGTIDVPVALEYLAETDLEASILGTPGSSWMFAGASAWPASAPPQEALRVQPSDLETLMVGGTIDFSTPPQFARDEVLSFLSKGQHVTLAEFGHTDDIWELQPEATARLLTSFYATGVADDSLYTYQPVDFDVGLGFPELVKLLVAVPTLIVVLVVALVRRVPMNADLQFPQHSLLKSISLHILPGAGTTLVFVLLKPLLDPSGSPPLLAFLLAVLLVDLPLQLAILLFEGKRLNGRLSLRGVILYRDKLPWKTFTLVFVAAFVVVYALITLTTPLTTYLSNTLFSGLPEWMFLEEPTQYSAFAKNAVIALFVFQLVLTGVALPWVEELYFRGYLLPRISRYGAWAPLLGGILFALYHGWQLYSFVTVLLLGTALGTVVWWKRDIRIPIALHIFANALNRLMFLMAALAL